ncbi:Hint domain-containing protein [Roseovarius indicus]|uniref:Hint domain-containing protein n=1 Tax=Roseovarius indicus TaxID=540747 RepID=UPI0032EC2726
MAPTNNPGIVDGEDTGENMGLGYDDSNAPTDQGGDQITNGDDTIYGNGGDDTIDGAGGNDVIFGDGPDGTSGGSAREIFQWADAPGFADLAYASGFTQDTGEASITFSIENEDAGTQSQYQTEDQLTAGLDDEVAEDASFESVTNVNGNSTTYRWTSDEGTIEDVEFRVNDLDGDGLVEVRAYDENGNEVPVYIEDAGTGIDTSSTNGLPGDNFADSNDQNYTDDNDPEHSFKVSIPGPVAYFEVIHSQDGGGNSGVNVTDIAFNVSGGDVGTPGNDDLSGGDGDDVIDGGGGEDTIDGGDGDDTLSGGDDNDTITGGDGNEVVEDMDGDNTIDTSSDLGQAALPDRGYPGLFPADSDPNDDRDMVTTGDGNDSIRTGDDADTIVSGGGNDTINSGIDDDEVYAGDGDDLITTGEGSDYVEAGDGNDTVYGGLGPSFPDELNITDEDTGFPSPDLVTDNGMDTIYGGAGEDVIYGEDDNDLIFGGDDNDYIDGGIDQDTIDAGEGDDTLIGGQGDDFLDGNIGNDEMTGGDGNDTFLELSAEGADTITDFGVGDTGSITDGDQTNNDFVDLSSFYNDTTVADVNAAGGDFDTPLEMMRADAEDGRLDGNINGTDYSGQIGGVDLTLQDGAGGAVTGSALTYDNTNVPCFVSGTLIATRRGSVPIEELKAGDEVITMDHGFQKIRWIGSTTVPAEGSLAPVVIRKGAMGNERDLRVSPQHRMLVRGWHVELMFGKPEALVPAKALINDETVFPLEGGTVDYFHMMFDRHELVYAEGIPSESFHPGHVGMGAFAEDAREEILQLFPELREDVTAYSEPVRPTLKVREARVLAENPELIKE